MDIKLKKIKKSDNAVDNLPMFMRKAAKVEKNRLARLAAAKKDRDFKRMLEHYTAHQLKPKVLDEKQVLAIHLLADIEKKPSYEYVANRIGVTITTIYNWLQTQLFLDGLNKEITRRHSSIRLHAFRNVARAVRRGSMKDTWKYLEMTGDLKKGIVVEDRTGEKDLTDEDINEEIAALESRLASAHVPSGN